MAFNIGLSGLKASSVDLEVTGNNIANASTVGFKRSRAEFGDIFANGFLNSGSASVGDGVLVRQVRQQFAQGNISSTDNGLDLAVDGEGFFALSNNGQAVYTRAGQFGLDKDGFVVNNQGMVLQGFAADTFGNINGISGDLQVQATSLPPERTTLVQSQVNLDSRQAVLASRFSQFTSAGTLAATLTPGNVNGFPQQGWMITDKNGLSVTLTTPANASAGEIASTLSQQQGISASAQTQAIIFGNNFDPAAPDFSATPAVFDTLTINGVQFQLDPLKGVSGLANDINASSLISTSAALDAGGNLVIRSTNGSDLAFQYSSQGVSAAVPPPSRSIEISAARTDPTGNTIANGAPFTLDAVAQPTAVVAGEVNFNVDDGFSLAPVVATFQLSGYTPGGGETIDIAGVPVMDITTNTPFTLTQGASGLNALAQAINDSNIPGIRAVMVGADLQISSNQGVAVPIAITGLVAPESVAILSETGPVTLDAVTPSANFSSNQIVSSTIGQTVINNVFNPLDPATFNHSTSTTIFDSLGNPHVMTQFFVKEPATGPNPANLWSMYVQIDGQDVGDPVAQSVSGQNQPTVARFTLVFNSDGTLNNNLSDNVLISNWTPLDAQGNPSGAAGPLNVANGGALPVPLPPTSSNFELRMNGSSQFGANFSVDDLKQDGFTTGRISGLDIAGDGVVFARFTNGQSQILGQVVLANFRNPEGLAPAGNTNWVETFDSGTPILGAAGSGGRGNIRSSSIEESNVDLSQELVALIIAQRNFQANAKTIETSDTVTQTIINLR